MLLRQTAEDGAHKRLLHSHPPFQAHFWNARNRRANVFRTGRLTQFAVEGLIKDAMRLGSRGRVDLTLGEDPDAASLDWLEEQLARVETRGVKVHLRVSAIEVSAPAADPFSATYATRGGSGAEPVAPVPVPPGCASTVGAERHHRVIVAEDDDDQRRFLGATLRGSHLDVVEVGDGLSLFMTLQRGIRAGREEEFDAVVTDVEMPDFSGLEVLRAVRGSAQRVPAVLVTAYDSAAVRAEARSVGVHAILPKPLDPRQLRAVVFGIIAAAD